LTGVEAHIRINTLQCRVKALTAEVASLKSGQALADLRAWYDGQLADKNREIRALKLELGNARSAAVTMRKNWMQVFDDICEEHRKELAAKDRRAAQLEGRLSALQGRLDAAQEKIREKTAELYRVGTELEAEKGKCLDLKAQINRDHENSSIPSSQKPNRKRIANNREKSGKKPGGQPGHKGHGRQWRTPTDVVYIPAPSRCAEGGGYIETGKILKRQAVSLDVRASVVEYRTPEYRDVRTGRRVHADFPPGVENEVNYGGNVKAAALLLNSYCNGSIDKTREMLSALTGGVVSLSKGMVGGLCREFSGKTEQEREKAFADLQLSPVMNIDFTGARAEGKSAQVAVCAAPGLTLYFAREHKGHKGVEGTPAERYHGTLVHDHDATFYSYGDGHQECLCHILRYLKDSVENEPGRTWNAKMRLLLQEAIHYRNGYEGKAPDIGKAEEFEKRYREVLETAKAEYEYEPHSEYYKDGYNLYRRLDEHMAEHLLFLRDLRVPADNNLCERKARVFKRKQKQVMGFRGFGSMACLCDCLSVFDLLQAKQERLFAAVSQIFDRGDAVCK